MRGGHLAILRDAKYETKESEVAAGDIVPVPGAQFEVTSYTPVLPATVPGIGRYLGPGLV